jgi:hypothetical protein
VYTDSRNKEVRCIYPSGAFRCPMLAREDTDCSVALDQYFAKLAADTKCLGKRTYIEGTDGWDPRTMATRAEPTRNAGVTVTAQCACAAAPVVNTAGRCVVRGYSPQSDGINAEGGDVLTAAAEGEAVGKSPFAGLTGGAGKVRPFGPTFPSSSPHVVSVGAAALTSGDVDRCASRLCSERGVSRSKGDSYTSGGGMSYAFGMPSWQVGAVRNYLGSRRVKAPPSSFFDAFGRGYPDLSAVAVSCVTVDPSGAIGPGEGSACAAAIVAGIMARVAARVGGS